MSRTSPEIEALEAPETEEEQNIDELEEALEASRGKVAEDDVEQLDEEGEGPPKEVAPGEPKEDTGEGVDEGVEEVSAEEERDDEAVKKEDLLEQQNRELRQLLREQKRELALLRGQVGRVETGLRETMEEDEKQPPELSDAEKLQYTIAQIGRQKGTVLETLVEAMEMKPQYSDLREVCSRENFDDIFEEVGKAIAAKEGIDPVVASLALEAEVWQMDNPYKYMYGIIKDHHPKYAKKEPAKVPEKTEKTVKKVPEPATAPTSIASVGGSDADTKSGWTSKRIDNLAEEELDQVPQKIYEKYLRGELD